MSEPSSGSIGKPPSIMFARLTSWITPDESEYRRMIESGLTLFFMGVLWMNYNRCQGFLMSLQCCVMRAESSSTEGSILTTPSRKSSAKNTKESGEASRRASKILSLGCSSSHSSAGIYARIGTATYCCSMGVLWVVLTVCQIKNEKNGRGDRNRTCLPPIMSWTLDQLATPLFISFAYKRPTRKPKLFV
jgi:hypothetical protein